MTEGLVLVDEIDLVQEKFKATYNGIYEKQYNIKPGQKSLVITDDKPNILQIVKFGFTPFYEKRQLDLTEARAEGDHNLKEDSQYRGSKGIILKKEFRKAIRYQRCLVIVSAYINIKESEAKLIHFDTRPISLAGIWDTWQKNDNQIETGFAIVTIAANELLQKNHIERMPVVLKSGEESTWLSQNSGLSEITRLLRPYSNEKTNGYSISFKEINGTKNTKEILKPIGPPFQKNEAVEIPKTTRYWTKKQTEPVKKWRG